MKIGYARLTTKEERGGLESQEAILASEGCSRVFRDTLSGAEADWPGLMDALACARDGEDTLVVTRLDRLGRSLTDALRIVEELTERKLGLQAIDVKLDTSTASGQLMLEMLLKLSEWERELVRERTIEGLARAKAAGILPGPKRKLSPQQEEEARNAVGEGHTIASVARAFGVSRPTIYKALQRGHER